MRSIPTHRGNRVAVIEHEHIEIHEAEMFFFSKTLARNSAEVVEILFKTSGTRMLSHMEFLFSSLLGSTWSIFEGTGKSYQSGNALTMFNRFRPSSKQPSSDIQVCHTPGAGADGTEIDNGFCGSGSGPLAPGGNVRSEGELVLKPGVAYLLRITSSVNSNQCKIFGQFYEHWGAQNVDITTTTTTSTTTTTTA